MELMLDPTNIVTPLIILVITFFAAQSLKLLLDLTKGKHPEAFENGGMPSVHTAIMVALNFVVLVEVGMTMLFVVTLVLAALIINDAMSVRYEVTRHSNFLNELLKKKTYKTVGHTLPEVISGSIIGLAIPLLLYTILG